MEVSGQLHAPAVLSPQNKPGIHLIVGCLGPRIAQDFFLEKKISLATH